MSIEELHDAPTDVRIIDQFVDAVKESFPEQPQKVVEEKQPEKVETPVQAETPETNTLESEFEVESMDKPQTIDLGFDDIKDVEVLVGDNVVSVSSLKDGYMRNADYTRKTQTLSAEKREVDSIKAEYANGLDFLNEQANQALNQYSGVNWQDLKVQDPANYEVVLKEYQEIQKAVQGVQQHRNAFIDKANAERQANIKQQAIESNDILRNIIPDWGTAKYSKLREYAATSELHIGMEEFEQVTDWRFMRLLDKAMNYDDAQNITTKKVKKSLKTSITPKTAKHEAQASQTGRKKALSNLKKSGSDTALMDIYAQEIGDMGIF